jgi:hypothetical protein
MTAGSPASAARNGPRPCLSHFPQRATPVVSDRNTNREASGSAPNTRDGRRLMRTPPPCSCRSTLRGTRATDPGRSPMASPRRAGMIRSTRKGRSGRRTHQVRQARRRIVLDARLPASTFRAIPCRPAGPAPRLRRGHRLPAGRKRADRVPRSRRLGPRLRVSASDPRLLTASPTRILVDPLPVARHRSPARLPRETALRP